MKRRLFMFITSLTLMVGTLSGCSKDSNNSNNLQKESTKDYKKTFANDLSAEYSDVKKIKVGGEFENSLVSFIESNGYENENYMISPTSYRAAIVLATAGADAQTKDKLLKAIGFKDMDEANNWYNRVLSSSFAYKKNAAGSFEFDESNDSCFYGTFRLENSVWKNTDYKGTITDEYKDYVKKHYNAAARNVSANEITDEVNNWVKKNTNNLIPKISDDLSGSNLVLANTLYLKSSFMEPFKEYATKEDYFVTCDGKTVSKDFMNKCDFADYYEDKNGKLIILPLRGKFKMVVTLGDIKDLKKAIDKAQSKEVRISIPKFEIDSFFKNKELVKFLKYRDAEIALGDNADFSVMCKDCPLLIDNVLQKTKIKVNEDGVEATAATIVEMKETSCAMEEEIKEFKADRPFKFMILNGSDNPEILFYGQLVE